MMNNVLHPNFEAPNVSAETETGVLFVDLDETVLDGTINRMDDEELRNADVIDNTVNLIHKAKAKGIPVIMVTRNNYEFIERFFLAKPELRPLFNETIACETGQKSSPINGYLVRNRIKKALFIDDTAGERSDVERNTEEVLALHPNDTSNIGLKEVEVEIRTTGDLRQMSRKKLFELLKKTSDVNERQRIEEVLESTHFVNTDQIKLAA